MMDDGLFGLISPDEIYVLHISPFPKGTCGTKPEGGFANYKKIKVSLKKSHDIEEVIDFTKNKYSTFNAFSPKVSLEYDLKF